MHAAAAESGGPTADEPIAQSDVGRAAVPELSLVARGQRRAETRRQRQRLPALRLETGDVFGQRGMRVRHVAADEESLRHEIAIGELAAGDARAAAVADAVEAVDVDEQLDV